MGTAADFPVKWISSEMPRAPQLSSQTSCFHTVLDALLVTGWGAITPQRIEIAGGIATVQCNIGDTFVEHCVIEVSGAEQATLNGQFRVLSSSDTSFTFATDAPDGFATGNISIKAAAAGWERVFSDEGKSAYRSTAPESPRLYYVVDDSAGNHHATVRGYQTMTDIDTGAGAFPPEGNDCLLYKSNQQNNWPVEYDFFADPLAVLMANTQKYESNNLTRPLNFFGTPAFAFFEKQASADVVCAPSGWKQQNCAFNGEGWTADGQAATFVSALINLSLLAAKDKGMLTPGICKADGVPCSFVPGAWLINEQPDTSLLPPRTLAKMEVCGDVTPRTCMALPTPNGTWPDVLGAIYVIDITGPWR